LKPAVSHNRNGVISLRLLFPLLCGFLPLLTLAAPPAWWVQRGVTSANVPADDYAPANQGQLKNIAQAAMAEMDANLPGGAGQSVHDLIGSWSNPATPPNDFAPVNLGQLKNVAKPFYDRLIAEGVVAQYPWANPQSPPDDFSVANIGQVKNLFSFEIP
jgi:hypothetical protein